MNQKRFKVDISKDNLTKMEAIYKNYHKQRLKLEHNLKRTEIRLNNTTQEVLKRRFKFDITQIKEQLNTTKNKEIWARRMIDTIKMALACDNKGDLKQNPFGALKNPSP